MSIGATIRIRNFFGETKTVRLIGETDDGPLVCSEEEFEAAQREGREPEGTGWPADSILDAWAPD